jgi:hypothetical protein
VNPVTVACLGRLSGRIAELIARLGARLGPGLRALPGTLTALVAVLIFGLGLSRALAHASTRTAAHAATTAPHAATTAATAPSKSRSRHAGGNQHYRKYFQCIHGVSPL